MDRITSMASFVQVVEKGSFIAAAKYLGISAPMVSSHIQWLEKRLGVQLLNRTTRKVSLTEAGSAFYDRCTQILSEVEDAERLASALQSSPRGTIRLNISIMLARLVAPIITDYCRLYPEVSVEMIMTDRLVDLLHQEGKGNHQGDQQPQARIVLGCEKRLVRCLLDGGGVRRGHFGVVIFVVILMNAPRRGLGERRFRDEERVG